MFIFKNFLAFFSVFACSSAIDIVLQTAIQNAIADLPDPLAVDPITDDWQISNNIKGTFNVTGLSLTGLSNLALAQVSWEVPLLQYTLNASTLIVNVGTLDLVAYIYGVKLDAVLSGKITITGSTINGTLVLDTATRTVTSSLANFNLGNVQPQLTAKIGNVDISSPWLNLIIGEIVPVIVDNVFNKKPTNLAELVAAIVADCVTDAL